LLWHLLRVNQEVAQAIAHSEQCMLWAVRWQALANQGMEVALAGVQSSEEALIASANDKARQLWAAAEQARAAVLQRVTDAGDKALMQQAQTGQAALLQHYEAAFRARDLGQAWEVQKLLDSALLSAAKAQVVVVVVVRFIAQQEGRRTARRSGGRWRCMACCCWRACW